MVLDKAYSCICLDMVGYSGYVWLCLDMYGCMFSTMFVYV
jgi:hypothetical protein